MVGLDFLLTGLYGIARCLAFEMVTMGRASRGDRFTVSTFPQYLLILFLYSWWKVFMASVCIAVFGMFFLPSYVGGFSSRFYIALKPLPILPHIPSQNKPIMGSVEEIQYQKNIWISSQ